MTKREKIQKATDDIITKLKKRFPNVKIKGVIEWMNADVAIKVETPTDNGWEISEFTAPIQMKYAMDWNISITVLPLEKVDGRELKELEK
jgi:hypothetical protein